MGHGHHGVPSFRSETLSVPYSGLVQRGDCQLCPVISSTVPQVTTMLQEAFQKIPDGTGLILHTDQGWQYRMAAYHEMLLQKGIRQSMSRKGNCLENAVMENFFGHLKSVLLYNQIFTSIEHFISELHEYMRYYNYDRIKKKLNYMSPVAFRLLKQAA